MKKAILVTGSSGRIGRAVVAELLQRGHNVRGFDLAPSPALPATIIGTLADRAALDLAMAGVTCVVHLAATPDDDDFCAKLVPNNITGLHHVMEAARAAGVARIVLASSGQVNWWQQMRGPFPVREADPVTPRGWYAATKMFMEAIGFGFAEMHSISVIVTRLGWCPRPGQEGEIAALEWAHDVYFSPGDAGRFFACCVEAPDTVRHLVVNGASRPLRAERIDLTRAKTVLGYEPRDQYPAGM